MPLNVAEVQELELSWLLAIIRYEKHYCYMILFELFGRHYKITNEWVDQLKFNEFLTDYC